VLDSAIDLKFDCVVEGVETAEQVEVIGRLGCSTMQEYFFAKPMPQGEVETFIANYRMSDNPRMAAAAV
jgi:EAL domain-containing protein (putative c-di-GMP-specific phosphodiesterase class I)